MILVAAYVRLKIPLLSFGIDIQFMELKTADEDMSFSKKLRNDKVALKCVEIVEMSTFFLFLKHVKTWERRMHRSPCK